MARKNSEYGFIDKKHKTVMKDFVTKRSYCDDKKCKFYGKMAEQGVCYSVPTHEMSKYWDYVLEQGEEMLKEMRTTFLKYYKGKKKNADRAWVKRMESTVVCAWANGHSNLDELVWMRGENAKLRGKLGIFKKR